jgi:hypothetical protein
MFITRSTGGMGPVDPKKVLKILFKKIQKILFERFEKLLFQWF